MLSIQAGARRGFFPGRMVLLGIPLLMVQLAQSVPALFGGSRQRCLAGEQFLLAIVSLVIAGIVLGLLFGLQGVPTVVDPRT